MFSCGCLSRFVETAKTHQHLVRQLSGQQADDERGHKSDVVLYFNGKG